MKARHQVSRNAIELIKRFEGYRGSAAQLADGRWTIGYGHTLTAREGAKVSLDDAEALLMYDLIAVAHAVNEHSYTPLNQNQFDALASFAFNVGVENFRRSAVLRRLNEGALIQAACAMEMWRKADFAGERIVIDALVRRRSAEKHLFLTPPEGWVAAPSPILPPKVDYDASYAVPRQAPAPVTGSLDGDRAEARLVADPGLAVPVPPEDEPTASELAAAAVGARLESLLPDENLAPEAPPPPADTTALDVPPMPEDAPAQPEPQPEAAAQPETAPEPAPERASTEAWPSPFVAPTLEEQAALEAEAESAAPEPAPEPQAEPEPASEPQPEPVAEAVAPPAPEPAETPAERDPMNLDGETLFDHAAPPRDEADAPWRMAATEDRSIVNSFDPAFSIDAKPGSTKATPLLVGAVVSLVLFAGGVFGGLNAASDTSGTFLTAKAVSWILCMVGAVGFVAAAYLLLRLLDSNDQS